MTFTQTVTREFPDLSKAPPGSKPYQPYGVCKDIFTCKDQEFLICGPSGTGKSRAALERIHLLATKYDGGRFLIIRKTRASLTQTGMVTFERFVLPDGCGVKFRSGEQEYRYPNGSILAVGGIDYYSKIMSSEYDVIFAMEATELSEEDWEALTTRARFGRMPYNQVYGDCNPGPPTHWLKRRCDMGKTRYFQSVHENNPTLYDHKLKKLTPAGVAYIAKLDALSGVRYKRLRLGLWAASEGMIYEEYNPDIHLIKPFAPPKDWMRVWIIDFGFTAPLCFQAWAVNGDGEGFMFFEIYQTGLLVEDACALIHSWLGTSGEGMPSAIIADHDAEGRATFERHMRMETEAADKSVKSGIDSVKSHLKIKQNGRPSLYFMRDALLEPDPFLVDAAKPICTTQEFESYEWHDKRQDEPKKVDDHGMDGVRYFSKYLDSFFSGWTRSPGG